MDKHLNFDDRRELEYAERAVAFLVKKRKEIAEELARERRIVNRLKKKARAIADNQNHESIDEAVRRHEEANPDKQSGAIDGDGYFINH